MEIEHIMGLSCTMDELPAFIKEYHKKYGKVAGTEISIRYGTDHHHINPQKVCVQVFVSRTKEKSLFKGSHTKHYHQEFIPTE